MKKPTRTLAILCAAAATAALGDYSWNVTTGGALDAAANWTPQGTPGSSDAVTLRYAQSAPCSLAGTDLSNAREIAVNVPSRRGTIISFK